MLNLHKCFQIKTVKVLLYFPGSLMFRNKHWQCSFRAFWSISAHVSSALSPTLVELAIFSGDSKVQAWKLYFKKGEIRQSAAWETPAAAVYCSQGTLVAPGHNQEQSPVLDVAQHHPNPSQQTCVPPHMASVLSLFLSFFLFSPPAFINLQPLCCTSYGLLSMEDAFSTPPLIPCAKTPLQFSSLMACFALTQRTNSNI